MYLGFPSALVSVLRCPEDQAALAIQGHSAEHIRTGTLTCVRCARCYGVRDGIVCLLADAPAHVESALEMQVRDQRIRERIASGEGEWRSAHATVTEMLPTVASLGDVDGRLVVELGCGSGRYTTPLLERGARVLAVDFSFESLQLLARGVKEQEVVGLVQADVSKLAFAPRSIDCMMSTLHSNLPTRDHRMASLRLAAEALVDSGRFSFSVHLYGPRAVVGGEPQSGHYVENGIYRYHMRPAEVVRETAPYFARLRFEPLNVNVPGIPSLTVSRLIRRTPVGGVFARLLLAVADHPRRQPVDELVSPMAQMVSRLLGRPRPPREPPRG
jgi:SAM-dependent methyltransferase